MLDARTQAKLDRIVLGDRAVPVLSRLLGSKPAVAAVAFLCGLACAAVIARHAAQPGTIPANQLGQLTVLVAERANVVPLTLWLELERRMGKDPAALTAAEQLQAVDFLISWTEHTQQQKNTLPIW